MNRNKIIELVNEYNQNKKQNNQIIEFLDDGKISIDKAAASAKMTVEDFLKKREELGKKSSF